MTSKINVNLVAIILSNGHKNAGHIWLNFHLSWEGFYMSMVFKVKYSHGLFIYFFLLHISWYANKEFLNSHNVFIWNIYSFSFGKDSLWKLLLFRKWNKRSYCLRKNNRLSLYLSLIEGKPRLVQSNHLVFVPSVIRAVDTISDWNCTIQFWNEIVIHSLWANTDCYNAMSKIEATNSCVPN